MSDAANTPKSSNIEDTPKIIEPDKAEAKWLEENLQAALDYAIAQGKPSDPNKAETYAESNTELIKLIAHARARQQGI